jgi:glycerophosphoryl diester phosphodiesterase
MHPDTIAAYGIRYLDYQNVHYEAHPDWVERFKKDGIHLNVWTVNKEDEMDLYLAQDFDYITTDHPALLLEKYRNR